MVYKILESFVGRVVEAEAIFFTFEVGLSRISRENKSKGCIVVCRYVICI